MYLISCSFVKVLHFIMSLASTREKRCNAGNRMSRMLEEEQEDDFYKTTYGGFAEVGNRYYIQGESKKMQYLN